MMIRKIGILFFTTLVILNGSSAQTIVTPGNGTLGDAITAAEPGDIFHLIGGAEYTHSSTESFIIDMPITIAVQPGSEKKAILRLADSTIIGPKYYFFRIMDGASLTLKGIDINGFVNRVPAAQSMILFDGSPDPTQSRIGTIRIEDCVIHDFKDNIFHGMKEATMKGIQQDSLFINNVIVYNVDAFLQYKHVSLHYLELKNSTIYKLRSMAIKIGKERYRGYTKISPTAFIDHCTFDDMGGDHGHIQVDDAYFPFTVSNSIISNIQKDDVQPGLFMNDPKIEPSAFVINTCFWKSGPTASQFEPYWPGYVFQDSLTTDPMYRDADKGDFALPFDSPLVTFGTDGGQIGDPRWGTYGPLNVRLEQKIIPEKLNLSQNYPNPFNPTTIIEYSLPKSGYVRLNIYDMLGRHIRTLLDSHQQAGHFQTSWNGTDERNIPMAAGVYLCRMDSGEFVMSIKLALVR